MKTKFCLLFLCLPVFLLAQKRVGVVDFEFLLLSQAETQEVDSLWRVTKDSLTKRFMESVANFQEFIQLANSDRVDYSPAGYEEMKKKVQGEEARIKALGAFTVDTLLIFRQEMLDSIRSQIEKELEVYKDEKRVVGVFDKAKLLYFTIDVDYTLNIASWLRKRQLFSDFPSILQHFYDKYRISDYLENEPHIKFRK